jgi:NTP pyrophosphatase (non-canonical NTP hydrolase)
VTYENENGKEKIMADSVNTYPTIETKTNYAMLAVEDELKRARAKFPNNLHMLATLTEEVGELAQALMDRDYSLVVACESKIFKEAIQVATMAIRVATEGDSSFKYNPGHYFKLILDRQRQTL